MALARRRGANNKAKKKRQLSVGDLVLAKVKGFPAWPAKVSLFSLNYYCYGYVFYLFIDSDHGSCSIFFTPIIIIIIIILHLLVI